MVRVPALNNRAPVIATVLCDNFWYKNPTAGLVSILILDGNPTIHPAVAALMLKRTRYSWKIMVCMDAIVAWQSKVPPTASMTTHA